MRVLILNQYALPAGSAGITRHADIGAELVRRGHQVTVIASNYDYLHRRSGGREQRSEVMDDGVRFIWLRDGRVPRERPESRAQHDAIHLEGCLGCGASQAEARRHRRVVTASACGAFWIRRCDMATNTVGIRGT